MQGRSPAEENRALCASYDRKNASKDAISGVFTTYHTLLALVSSLHVLAAVNHGHNSMLLDNSLIIGAASSLPFPDF